MLKSPETSPENDTRQFDKIVTIAELALSSTARIAKIQMAAACRALEESVEIGMALSQTNDQDTLIAIRARLEKKGAEQMIDCSKELYDAVVDSRTHLVELINESISKFGNDLQHSSEKALPKFANVTPMPLYDMQEYMNSASQVIENLGKLAQQANRMTQVSIDSAMSAVPAFTELSTKPAKS
jgi:phasin family protein